MLSILDAVSDEMEPTRTYARRVWLWVPADTTHPAWDGRLGDLTIQLQRTRRAGCRVEQDTYAVQDEYGPDGREFLLLNLTDPDQEDVYRVHPESQTCSCTAAQCGQICKHRDALSALLARGHL